MRVTISGKADELTHRLSSQGSDDLPKIILINGNEPLFVEEALNQVRAALKPMGFDERISLQLEAGFDWNAVTGVGQAMSLFSQRRLIELRVPKSLGAQGTKAITEYCEKPPEDDVLVLLMPALDKRQRQAKWAKFVDNTGWIADCYDLSPAQFPSWIKHRLQSRALRVESGVVELLAAQLEGNVLAAAQEIDKLQVLAADGAVTLKLLTSSLADQAKFDVYALSDACLSGDFTRVLRVKERLQSEGIEPVIVLWSLVREIRTMAIISAGLAQGENRSMLFKQHRIWSKREPTVNSALSRLNSEQWYSLLEQAGKLDQTVKGQRYEDVGTVWYQLEQLCSAMCDQQIIELAKTA